MEIRKTNDQTRSADRVQGLQGVQESGSVGPKPHADKLAESREATREARQELQRAKENGDPKRRDRIDLSERAQAHVRKDLEGEAMRADLVSELREAYNSGSLMSSERVESAARRLLGERV